MEFEDQEEEEHEGDVEMGPSYDSLGNSNNIILNSVTTTPRPTKMAISSSSPVPLAAAVIEPQSHSQKKPIRYRECLKNHAVGIGGHAVDGCGEFLPAGAEGTLDALKCAACNCHRNFHRRETNNHNGGVITDPGFHFHHHPPLAITHPAFYRTPTGYLHVAPHQQQQHPTSSTRPLALPSTSGGGYSSREEQEDMSNMNSGGGGAGGGGIFMSSSSSKKRFRTKFSQEQKDKMLEMAERLGWRIQKQDEEAVQQLCNELGIRRHVLKVWMHNNKHTLGKKP